MQQKNVIVEITNADLKYDEETIVEKINWVIKRGEFWALMGENGAGKSTLAKYIANLYDSSFVKAYGKVIYLPQYIYIEGLPVYVNELLYIYGVRNKYIKLFNLDKYIDKRIDELSGGMIQSLFISIMLSEEADLYILDEPTNYLDYEREEILFSLLDEKIKEGKSIIVITHEIDWVKKNIRHVACIHKKEKRLMFHCPIIENDKYKVNHNVNIHY